MATKICALTYNVLGLAEVGELEAQMFNLAQMYNRIPNAQFSTSAPFCQTLVSGSKFLFKFV